MTEPAAAPAREPGDESKQGEEECGWCKWMKAGGCKEQFEVWLKCVDAVRDAGREDVETCSSVMAPLWDCMQVHAEYYSPQMEALKEKRSGQEGAENAPEDGAGSPPASPPPTISTTAALDIDNITEADIERLLEDLEKEDAKSSK